MGVVLLCGSSIAGIIAVQCCITHIWSTGNAAKAALKFFSRKFRRCNFTVDGLPDEQGQAGNGEKRGEVDGGESRADTFFRNLSEHFSAQARRK